MTLQRKIRKALIVGVVLSAAGVLTGCEIFLDADKPNPSPPSPPSPSPSPSPLSSPPMTDYVNPLLDPWTPDPAGNGNSSTGNGTGGGGGNGASSSN